MFLQQGLACLHKVAQATRNLLLRCNCSLHIVCSNSAALYGLIKHVLLHEMQIIRALIVCSSRQVSNYLVQRSHDASTCLQNSFPALDRLITASFLHCNCECCACLQYSSPALYRLGVGPRPPPEAFVRPASAPVKSKGKKKGKDADRLSSILSKIADEPGFWPGRNPSLVPGRLLIRTL